MKIILSVQNGVNLTAQTPKYMARPDRTLVGVTTANFTTNYVLSLGGPSVVTLIHFYLSESNSSVITTIKELNALGYCMMFSLNSTAPSTGLSFMYNLGITSTVERWDANFPDSFYTLDNTFFNISGHTLGKVSVTHRVATSSRQFGYSLPLNNLLVPITKIAQVSSSDTGVYFGIIEKGTILKDAFVLKTPIIIAGFLYAAESHIPEVINPILDDIYQYADLNANPPYHVKGFVSSTTRDPLERKITVHNQNTGSVLNTSTSDSLGNYKVNLPTNDPVFIVCHPLDSTKKGQIHTNVIPLLNE